MREYLLTLLVCAAVTYLLTPVARRIATAVGALAPIRDRDVHAIPTPRLGGLAMFAGIAAALLLASRLPRLQTVFGNFTEPRAVLHAGAIVCLLGVVDDRWGLDSLTKLAGQILAAGVMVLEGVQLLWLPVPRFGTLVLGQEAGVLLTVLLVVATINAVNFVDGLDGLAAGVVGIAALAFFAYSYQLAIVHGLSRAAPPMLISASLVGACFGFLPHNFNPARVFMGDCGSMLIGLLLAASTISLIGQLDPGALTGLDLFPALLPLVLPVGVLAVPFVDLLLAIVRRSMAGRSPFAPDKQHLHHRLLEIGHSQTRAVLIMYCWSALLGFGGVAMSMTSGPRPMLLVVGVLALLAVIASTLPRVGTPNRGVRP
ncbi:MAG TPA: MraY family glycosyltransferase [Mycobacteriales bacterium]|nr:MraY family glycosyltransferase [Mycobacteriales bacterium]